MAERETVHVYVASRGGDAMVFFASWSWLDHARDLVGVLGGVGTMIVTGDHHRDGWRWSSPSRGEET